MAKKVGNVIHFYDKIGVAIIKLSAGLKKGDKIKFVNGDEDLFEQTVESMQYDHKDIDSAKKADEIGLKVDQSVKEGAEVHKVN